MTTDPEEDPPKRGDSGESSRKSRQRSSEPQGGIYAPPRSRDAEYGNRSADDARRPGIFSRLTGRHRVDEIRAERLQPYQYESNEQTLRWTAVTMAVWCCIMAFLAFTDWRNGQQYADWVNTGITTIPPSNSLEAQVEPVRLAAWRDGGDAMQCAYLAGRRTTSVCPEGELPAAEVDAFISQGEDYTCFQRDGETGLCTAVWTSRAMVEFARIEGFDCPDGRAVFDAIIEEGGTVGCDRVFAIGEEFQSSQSRSQLIWLFVVVVGFVVAFPYLSMIHRASRNLLTLRSRGQKHRPEWAVLHHFIPFFNFVMPGLVLRELFRGSDPRVGPDDEDEWKQSGRHHPIAFLWHLLWFLALWMNPIILPRLFGATDLPELVRTNNLLLAGDLILLALGIVGVLMLRQLHMWQQERHGIIGPITVTPPQPIDPLQEAMAKRDAEREDSDSNRD